MTSTSVKVIWAVFGSISTRLTRNLLIFNPCAYLLTTIEPSWKVLGWLSDSLSGTTCTKS